MAFNIAGIFLFFLLLRFFFIDTYLVVHDSMSNTLLYGDKVLISKLSPVRKGRIVVLHQQGQIYVKRCIGMPGEKISITRGKIVTDSTEYTTPANAINFTTEQLSEKGMDVMIFEYYNQYWNMKDMGPYSIPKKGSTITLDSVNRKLYKNIIEEETGQSYKEISGVYTFKHDYVFVIGDNRPASKDSRFFGPVKKEDIVGVAELVLYSKNYPLKNRFMVMFN
jgi:signal peptidase I